MAAKIMKNRKKKYCEKDGSEREIKCNYNRFWPLSGGPRSWSQVKQINGSQLAKMKKSIPDMSLSWKL